MRFSVMYLVVSIASFVTGGVLMIYGAPSIVSLFWLFGIIFLVVFALLRTFEGIIERDQRQRISYDDVMNIYYRKIAKRRKIKPSQKKVPRRARSARSGKVPRSGMKRKMKEDARKLKEKQAKSKGVTT